jgi:hypothetical protein
MADQRSKRTETPDASRVEYLMGLLRDLSQHDPSPALRERLEILSSDRFRNAVGSGKPQGRAQAALLHWLGPAFVAALAVVIGVIAAFVVQHHQPEPLRARVESRVAPPHISRSSGIQAHMGSLPPETRRRRANHPRLQVAQNTTSHRMIVRLPYSDSAINTGTDATIRVSMSQAELVSLGFPMNSTLRDRRVVAELILGDDGLPRAVSVPLPFQVIREKK